jgi:Transposase DDE domain
MLNTLLQRLDKLIRPERAQQLAKEHGWQKRKGKISSFEFLFSGLGQGSAVELTLNAQANSMSQPVSRQAIDQRYTPQAVDFFKAAFQEAMDTALTWKTDSAMTQLLQTRFAAVRLFDSTRCPCSDALATLFPASGGGGTAAGVKLLLAYEYGTGQIQPLELLPAKRSDQGLTERVVQQLGPGELGLWDKGFYKAAALRQVIERGAYFVTPWSQGVSVGAWNPNQQRFEDLDVAAALKAASTENCVEWTSVQLGGTPETRLGPVRLIAYRLGEEATNRHRAQLREKCRTHGRAPTEKALELAGWLILVTNAPPDLLPTKAVGFLYRVRWQVELIFKQFKSVLRLHVLPSGNPSRVQCELWGRLLMALLTFVWYQHLNAACFKLHECEISFAKVARLLQQQGQSLVGVLFGDRVGLESEYRKLWKKLLKLARKERQPSRPTTWENLWAHLFNLPVS